MMLTATLILLILAAICFGINAFGPDGIKVNLDAGGKMFLVIALIVSRGLFA